MTQEQKVRTRDEQVIALAKAIGPERIFHLLDQSYQEEICQRAWAHIEEAEARGEEEARRADAEGQGPVAWQWLDSKSGWLQIIHEEPAVQAAELEEMGIACRRLYSHPANVAALEARVKELEAENAQLRIRSLPEHLTDPLREVLGRMCFECITLARALRADGVKVPNRAEDEQAAVIFFLLPFVLTHGADWRKHAVEELGAMEARHSAALTCKGGE